MDMLVPIQDKQKMAVRVAVLRTLYVGGALSLVLLAPKASRLLGYLDRGKKHRTELYGRIRYAKARLKHEKLLRERDDGHLELTERGKEHVERILLREYVIPEPVWWDGKWRILMFDIKEKRRRIRFQLRQLLQGAGFVRLQDSVWVYPHPCDEFVELIRAHLSSGVGELRFVVVDALEFDRPLREHFKLP
jgi:CRISPR/Cas system-associated endoribonuclease Cas2